MADVQQRTISALVPSLRHTALLARRKTLLIIATTEFEAGLFPRRHAGVIVGRIERFRVCLRLARGGEIIFSMVPCATLQRYRKLCLTAGKIWHDTPAQNCLLFLLQTQPLPLAP